MKKRTLSVIITMFLLIISVTRYYNQLNEILLYEEEQYSIADPDTRENIYSLILDSKKNLLDKSRLPDNDSDGSRAGDDDSKDINLNALSAALIDGDSGRVLYEKDGNKHKAMASTTKIMTCILALEEGKLDDVVTVSKYASTMPDVQLHIKEGEEYYLRDMLYALMLESCNDVAVAVAEHIGGSSEGFASMMNKKAEELGCSDTNFVTSNGLDAQNHYTTAVEIARIASYAIQNQDFITITNTPNWTFTELTKGRSFMVSNKDRFLYMYDGAIGVKTGFTNNAGYCFVGAVKQNDNIFVSSVLGSGWPPNKNYKWRDTTSLMDYGTQNYEKNDIFYPHTFVPISVINGKEKISNLYYQDEIQILISKDDIINIEYYMPKYLEAPFERDTTIGKAIYYINDEFITEVDILTKDSIEEIDFEYCMDTIISLWLNRRI